MKQVFFIFVFLQLLTVCITAQKFEIVWKDASGCVLESDGTFKKVLKDGWGNTGIVSETIIGDIGENWLEFDFKAPYVNSAIGFTEESKVLSYTEIDYGLYFGDDGYIYVVVDGVLEARCSTVAENDRIKLVKNSDDQTMEVYKEKVLVWTENISSSSEYRIGVSGRDHGDWIANSIETNVVHEAFPLIWKPSSPVTGGLIYNSSERSLTHPTNNSSWAFETTENFLPSGKNGGIQFTAVQGHTATIGFASATSAINSLSSFYTSLYLHNNAIYVLKNGSSIGYYGKYDTGDQFTVERDGNNIRYYNDKVLIKSVYLTSVNMNMAVGLKYSDGLASLQNIALTFPELDLLPMTLSGSACGALDWPNNQDILVNDPNVSEQYEIVLYSDEERLQHHIIRDGLQKIFRIDENEEILSRRIYQIKIRAKVNGVWGPWSTPCDVEVIDPPLTPDCVLDDQWNSAKQKSFDMDGRLIGTSKSYSDLFGRVVQTQSWNFEDNTMMCLEVRYDEHGRKVLTTLPAPIYQDHFCYKEDFMEVMVNGTSEVYANQHFDIDNYSASSSSLSLGEMDMPHPVWHDSNNGMGSLGWYYSDDNSEEPYVAATDFPYTRVDYDELNPGHIRRMGTSHDLLKMGSGNEGASYSVYAAGELYYVYGYGQTWDPDIEFSTAYEPGTSEYVEFYIHTSNPKRYDVIKNISENPDGLQSVTFVDSDGKLVATCLVGTDEDDNIINRQSVSKSFNGGYYVDIHVTEGTEDALIVDTEYYYDIYDLKNGQKVASHIASNSPQLTPGCYRFVRSKDPITGNFYENNWRNDGEIIYDLSYHSWTINYYDKAGRLVSVVPPLGVDSTYEPVVSVSETMVSEPLTVIDIENEVWSIGISTLQNSGLSITITPASVDDSKFHAGALILSNITNPWNPIQTSKSLDQVSRKGEANAGIVLGSNFYASSFSDGHDEFNSRDDISIPWVWFDPEPGYSHPSGETIFTVTYDCYAVTPDGDVLISEDFMSKAYHKQIPTGSQVHVGGGALQDVYFAPTWTGFDNIDVNEFIQSNVNVIQNPQPLSFGSHPHIIDFEASNSATAMKFVVTDISYTQSLWPNSIPPMTLLTQLKLNGQVLSYFDAAGAGPSHSMQAQSVYNSLSHTLSVTSPDRGTSAIVRDRTGKVRFSQNAIQSELGKFIYVNYDEQDRVIEAGVYSTSPDGVVFEDQLDETSVVTSPQISVLSIAVLENDNWNQGSSDCSERHYAFYDKLDQSFSHLNFEQQVEIGQLSHNWNNETHTWYSYDRHGRMDWMIREYPDIGKKTIEYEYDLYGRLTKTVYQRFNSTEYFAHKFSYDDNNRQRIAYTSQNGVTWIKQAEYEYYQHGPLKRTVLADGLQGIDYIYTSVGMLKAINSPNLGTTSSQKFQDPGGDGYGNGVAPDVFGMTLDYFSGDYLRAGTYVNSGDATDESYSGFIRSQRWNTKGVNPTSSQWMYSYDYDKKGQFIEAEFGTFSPSTSINNNTGGVGSIAKGSFAADPADAYKVFDIDYDINGNITSLSRNAHGQNVEMDAMTYAYQAGTNQLLSISDNPAYSGFWPEDLDNTLFSFDPANEATHDFVYDVKGQMVSNRKDGHFFTYNAKGLVTDIHSDEARQDLLASYFYDDSGFRSRKMIYDGSGQLQRISRYVRGQVGMLITVVEEDVNASTSMNEYSIYGSSALGTYNTQGSYRYDLTDHLGNVRATIDLVLDGNDEAVLLSSDDYYPFGETMPGRSLQSSFEKRNGYQGQFAEKDEETGYDQFEARLWDGRVGRWMTVDPAGQFHSPYLGMGNNPINGVDPDGRLVIYVNGFLSSYFESNLWAKASRNPWGLNGYPFTGSGAFRTEDTFNGGGEYWHKGFTDKYAEMWGDRKSLFVNGGSTVTSGALGRWSIGYANGELLASQIGDGTIKLDPGETIKIIGHSHGGAHAAGLTEALITAGYGDIIAGITYIAPHQPGGFSSPEGIPSVQLSNRKDKVSSNMRFGNSLNPVALLMGVISPSNLNRIDGVDSYFVFKHNDGLGHFVESFTGLARTDRLLRNFAKRVRRMRRIRSPRF